MKNVIEKIFSHDGKTITEKELKIVLHTNEYESFANSIKNLVESGILSPVIASGTNGTKYMIYNKYRINKPAADYTLVLEKIKLLNPRLNISGYLKSPDMYLKYEKEIEALSSYLWQHADLLDNPMSQNERSLSIWGHEKYMSKNASVLQSILRFNNLSEDFLNYYNTPEPFIEYTYKLEKDMNILIIENKDTWFSIRKAMQELDAGNLLCVGFNMLLWGEGRKITRKVGQLSEYGREMLPGCNIRYYYFGDLDYEGIQIFLDVSLNNPDVYIKPFLEAYSLMLRLSEGMVLPETCDKRDKEFDIESFTNLFKEYEAGQILSILEDGRYIPQEIVNYQVIKQNMKGY